MQVPFCFVRCMRVCAVCATRSHWPTHERSCAADKAEEAALRGKSSTFTTRGKREINLEKFSELTHRHTYTHTHQFPHVRTHYSGREEVGVQRASATLSHIQSSGCRLFTDCPSSRNETCLQERKTGDSQSTRSCLWPSSCCRQSQSPLS